MKYQIQNHLGEVLVNDLTLEQLADYGEFDESGSWVTKAGLKENYFLFDAQDDLVTRWATNSEKYPAGDLENYKIVKGIEE